MIKIFKQGAHNTGVCGFQCDLTLKFNVLKIEKSRNFEI